MGSQRTHRLPTSNTTTAADWRLVLLFPPFGPMVRGEEHRKAAIESEKRERRCVRGCSGRRSDGTAGSLFRWSGGGRNGAGSTVAIIAGVNGSGGGRWRDGDGDAAAPAAWRVFRPWKSVPWWWLADGSDHWDVWFAVLLAEMETVTLGSTGWPTYFRRPVGWCGSFSRRETEKRDRERKKREGREICATLFAEIGSWGLYWL